MVEPVRFIADGVTYQLTHSRLAHSLIGLSPAAWALLENLVDLAEGKAARAPELATMDALIPLTRARLVGQRAATTAGHAVVFRVRALYDALAAELARQNSGGST